MKAKVILFAALAAAGILAAILMSENVSHKNDSKKKEPEKETPIVVETKETIEQKVVAKKEESTTAREERTEATENFPEEIKPELPEWKKRIEMKAKAQEKYLDNGKPLVIKGEEVKERPDESLVYRYLMGMETPRASIIEETKQEPATVKDPSLITSQPPIRKNLTNKDELLMKK